MEHFEEYPFRFMNTPSSLKQLAATEVALALWRYKHHLNSIIQGDYCLQPYYVYMVLRQFRYQEMLDVPIPSRIKAEIDEKIISIGIELRFWISFYSKQRLLGGDFKRAFSKCFKHIVANAFCSIDLKTSAINILNSGELHDVENYKIACALCLEDRVRRFWPSVAHDKRIIDSKVDADSLMFYWNRRMKLKRDSINDTLSIEKRIDTIFCDSPYLSVCNWEPFEYFLKIWPDDERESRTISFLERGGHPAMKGLLPTLNRLDAEKVFEEKAAEILCMLVQNDDYFQNVHQLWAVLGHTLLKDESSFFHILRKLWELVFCLFRDKLYLASERVNDFLLHMWSNAPDELNVAVSSNHIDVFFDSISYYHRPYCSQYMTFILELTKYSYGNREKLLQAHWRKFFFNTNPLFLEKLVKLCLPSDEAIELFKKHILQNSDDIFTDFVSEKLHSELKNYLNFCSNDAAEILQIFQRVTGFPAWVFQYI